MYPLTLLSDGHQNQKMCSTRLCLDFHFAHSNATFLVMLLDFTKMNGAGNDFVLIDNRERTIKLGPEQIVRLCDRHRGVGADGVMLLVTCASGKADWAWEFYNSDGSTG